MVDLVSDTMFGYLLWPFVFFVVGFTVTWYVLQRRRHRRMWELECYKHRRQQEIEDAIDRWHADPNNLPLHEHLGLTPKQYAEWLRDPDTIDMKEIGGCKKKW